MVVISYIYMVILGGISSQEPSALSPAGQYQVEKIIHSSSAQEGRFEIFPEKSISFPSPLSQESGVQWVKLNLLFSII